MPLGLDYDDDEVVQYFGVALPGKSASDPAWMIGRPVFTAGNARYRKVQWANVDRFTLDQVWDDRASLTYVDRPEIPLDWAFIDVVPAASYPTAAGHVFDLDCDLSGKHEVWWGSSLVRRVTTVPSVANQYRVDNAATGALRLGMGVDDPDEDMFFVRVWVDTGVVV